MTRDILLKGGHVADGETGLLYKSDVLVSDGKISRIAEDITDTNAETIDCYGKIITAGFIDAHVHIESSMVLPEAFGEAVLPHGTTSVIADPHEVVNVAGASGLHEFLDEAAKAPIDIFTVVPSSVPATPLDTNGAGKFLASDMAEFVSRPDIVGLGEVMCVYDVVEGNHEILDKIALFRNKTIDGHSTGIPEDILDKYIAAGIQNDHESNDTASMLARYSRGMNIYIREGSAARNANDLLSCVRDERLDISRFAFCTDDKHLATIAAEGHISYIVRMARSMGFSWGAVARMASYNPCRFYRLDNRGNIREGYIADIVVTDDTCDNISLVIKNGRKVAADGKLIHDIRRTSNKTFANTVHFRHLTPDDFAIPQSLCNIAIGLVDGQLLTRRIYPSQEECNGLSMLATIERYGKNGNMAVCLMNGYGIHNGAVATSVSHDSHNVICAGDNPADMAVACNRLKELGGGYVIASEGKVIGECALPAYGLMSDRDADTVSATIHELETKAHALGVNPGIDPFTTLSFVALPVIPSLRLLDTGLYDVDEGKFIS